MSQNDIQIGGNHYISKKYQHWDFVTDNNIPYLLGCSTKYISRWRDKDGIKDLKKSIHYIRKNEEKRIIFRLPPTGSERFAKQFPPEEKMIIQAICNLEYDFAIEKIEKLIENNTSSILPIPVKIKNGIICGT